MRILHVINALDLGGAQRLLTDMIPIMAESNEVEVLTLRHTETPFNDILKSAGIKISCLNAKSIRNPYLIIKIIPYLKAFDVIHVHLFPSLYLVSLAYRFVKNNGVMLCYTEHSTDNRRRRLSVLRPLEKFIYKPYHKIISISQSTQNNLKSWLNEDSDKFIVIPNGIPLEKFQNLKRNPSEKRVVMMISRFSYQKDQSTLIKAMKKMPDDVELWLVGDGQTIEECKSLASQIGVSQKVKFLGERFDIPQLLSQAYVGVQSSHWEGFGLTAVEIMASGMPIVASDVPGLADVVGKAGMLFKTGDENELSDKLLKLLKDKGLYQRKVELGLEQAAQFSIRRMTESYVSRYAEYNQSTL